MSALVAIALLLALVLVEAVIQSRLARREALRRTARAVLPNLDAVLSSLGRPVPMGEADRRLEAAFRAFGPTETALVAALLPVAGAGGGDGGHGAGRELVKKVLSDSRRPPDAQPGSPSHPPVIVSRSRAPELQLAPEDNWLDAHDVSWEGDSGRAVDALDRILSDYLKRSPGA